VLPSVEEDDMKQLTFALQFKGSAGPVPGSDTKLRAKASVGGPALRTALQAAGLEAGADTPADFESEVQIVGDGKFLEAGTITYGAAGRIVFETVGQGVLGPSGLAGLQRGAVIWTVTRGEGRLSGASGLITSNFTVGERGDVADNQFAVLFVP
jgi:hypothetical protein